MLVTYDLSRQKTAVLQNALNTVERDRLNDVSELSFALPTVDDKNRHCQPFHYVRWDGGALYRILDTSSSESGGEDTINYSCEHVIATLIDTIIFGTLQLDNLTTKAVLERILSLQKDKHWKLGQVDFDKRFSYSWSNENLLAALFSVPGRFEEEYIWVFDTAAYPWTVHLRRLRQDIDPQYYIREGLNLLAATLTGKARDICNRIYPLGYGEGVNQLTVRDANGGVPYVQDSASIAKYGLKERIWEDSRFEEPQPLLERARVLLRGYAKPYETWDVTAADLEKLTGQEMDRAAPGKLAQFGDLRTYIIEVERHLQEAGQDRLTLANAPEDVAGTIADLADRQRINSVYANGATNIYAQSFSDNANTQNPATIRFYIPKEAKQINKIPLIWSFEKFRAYNTGASTVDKSLNSTTFTDKSISTSTSEGGSKKTSTSGGGVDKSSGSSTRSTTGTSSEDTYYDVWSDGPTNRRGNSTTYANHVHNVSVENVESHDHDMSHTHNVSISSHSHEVTIDGHDHDVTIPSHRHDFTIPGHTHSMIYGIYAGPQAARATLLVDDIAVPQGGADKEIDITPYLKKDNSGKITRGTYHTIKIVPQAETGNPTGLTRISATLTVQVFIQSVGGGNY